MTIRDVREDQAGLPCPESTQSFWHSEPAEDLLGFRSTADLPPTADVVIVGSGLTGAFAAHFLKRGAAAGDSVVVLEAREACWGATGRNGGHCQPIVYASTPDVARFELATWAFVEAFVRDEAIPCDWRTLDGGVHAFLDPAAFALARRLVARLERRHPALAPFARVVDGATPHGHGELAALRVPAAVGAVVHARAASLWPYRLVAGILRGLLRAYPPSAFNLQTLTPVTSVRRAPPPSPAASASSPPSLDAAYPWRVATPRGTLRARRVLLATNGYTSHLLPSFSDLVVPVRGQVAALLPPSPTARLAHGYVLIGPDRNEYLTQHPRGRAELVFGGGRQLAAGRGVGRWRDDDAEPAVAQYLRHEAAAQLDLGPAAEGPAELEASFEWTGVMGYSRDGAPWVGAVPPVAGGGEGLFVCAGYTGHGMPVAPLCAREVARMMTGELAAGDGAADDAIPASFLVSEERMERARREPEVRALDELGCLARMEQLDAALSQEP